MATIVVKLGGSLYDLPDLGARVSALIAPFPDHRFLIFPGGGDAADLVRDWQPRFGWSDSVAHDVAIAALDFNAVMLANVLSGARVVKDHADAEEVWRTARLPILAPTVFLQATGAGDLPHDWTVTSDSLAAWVTWKWPAEELWLCKSVPCPTSCSAAINDGAIDPYFAELAAEITRVRWCNLRTGLRVDEWDIKS